LYYFIILLQFFILWPKPCLGHKLAQTLLGSLGFKRIIKVPPFMFFVSMFFVSFINSKNKKIADDEWFNYVCEKVGLRDFVIQRNIYKYRPNYLKKSIFIKMTLFILYLL